MQLRATWLDAAGPALRCRRLIVLTADLTETAWYPRGWKAAPRFAEPAGLEWQWLEGQAAASAHDPALGEACLLAARARQGARCLRALDADGRTMMRLWLSPHGTHIPWIFAVVDPPDGHLLIFDVWVHPACRGQSVYYAGLGHAFGAALEAGTPRLAAAMEEHEFRALARALASRGLACCVAHAQLSGCRLGRAALHCGTKPPRRLTIFNVYLRRRYLAP